MPQPNLIPPNVPIPPPVPVPPPPPPPKPHQLFCVYDYPHAGTPLQDKQQSTFDEIRADKPDGLPYFPWDGNDEWSLVKWLATSGLSSAKIDEYLKLPWVIMTLLLFNYLELILITG